MPVFTGKTHNLQTRKYDVSMTSPVTKNNYLLRRWNTCLLLNIPWKFYGNLNIFHGDIKENMSGCFFLNTVYICANSFAGMVGACYRVKNVWCQWP